MPTILVVDGFRFFFWSNEGAEPPHVHVEKADAAGKWWLEDLSLAYQDGFTPSQLRKIRGLLTERHQEILDGWTRHFG